MKYKGAVSEDDLLAIHEEEAEASGLAVPTSDKSSKGGRKKICIMCRKKKEECVCRKGNKEKVVVEK